MVLVGTFWRGKRGIELYAEIITCNVVVLIMVEW